MADYKVDVDVNVNNSKLDELEKRINNLKNKTVKVNIEADSSSIKGIESLLKNASKTQTFKMRADASGVKKEVSSALKSINSISMKPTKLKVDADTSKATSGLKEINNTVRTLKNGVKVGIKVDGVNEAGKVFTYIEKLNKDGEKTTTIKVKDEAVVKAKSNAQKLREELKAVESIKLDLKVGNIENEFSKVETNFGNLKNASKDAKLAIDELRKSKKSLDDAYSSGANNKELVNLHSQYKEAFKIAKNQIDINTRAEKQAAAEAKQAAKERANAVKQAAQEEAAAVKQVAEAENTVNKIRQKANKGGLNRGLTDDFTDVEEKMRRLGSASSNLDDTYKELITSRREFETALAGTDNQKIISASERYKSSLEKIKSEIKSVTAAKKEQDAIDKTMMSDMNLRQKANSLSLSMDSWLSKNTAATKTFGGQIEKLKAQLISCDAVQFNNIQGQFKQIQTQAELAGKTDLSFGDKIKAQFSKLGTYFGASSIILAGIQGVREAFQNVLDVDTQLTELYRVTDLTSQQYSDVYDKLTVSAKEYGSTLTDLISATADWSRAGFDADTAAGLAEVTSVYQHISDLDYDEAAENLLTAYKGFESELKDNFNDDAVSAVGYVSDILNELDNNYSVTAAGVGEAMKRSASAMSVAGNTIQETAG